MQNLAFDEINQLVDEYRDRCLWFLKPGFFPTTPKEALQTLVLIERYGDRAAYQRAERLKKWLSQLISSARLSRDIDLFHDTEASLASTCIVSMAGELFKGDVDFLVKELKNQSIQFHAGRIGGSWPIVK
ncbi:MAG: hypothetical protein WC340_13355 [Kiritimatiellia bacterium]